MTDVFGRLFDPTGFPPLFSSGPWSPVLDWTHVLSDVGIWAAYLAIPLGLWYCVARRRDVPFRGVVALFGAFVLAGGTTHLMEAVLFWWPAYRLAGLLKVTALLVSWAAVVALYRTAPRLLALRSPEAMEREVAERTSELARANAALRASEARFRQLADAMPPIVWITDPDGETRYLNRRWAEYTGLTGAGPDEIRRVVHADDLPGMWDAWAVAVRTGGSFQYEFRLRPAAGGAYRWFLARSVRATAADGAAVGWYGTSTDIDDLKIAEEQVRRLATDLEYRVAERTAALEAQTADLRESEERFRSAFEDAPIGMALVAPTGRLLRVNRALCDLLGYGSDELLATHFQSVTHPDDLEADLVLFLRALAGEFATYQMEKRYHHKQGHVVHALLSVSLVRTGAGEPMYFVGQVLDFTRRKQAEDQLRASLREKEVLLREIHHRVKNNLQIVSALLDLQADHTADPAALTMFRESRGRVRSMALIHERLYRSGDLARVDFSAYARQLADDLFRSYKVGEDRVRLVVDVAVPPFPLDVAIPCGLLINELISNCLKHAFRGRDQGTVAISLAREGAANVLVVADDGVGFPPELDFRRTASFGLQLVNTLVEQLAGAVELAGGRGTRVVIRFPAKG